MVEVNKINDEQLTYRDLRFYTPRYTFDRSMYPEGQKIDVVYRINKNIFRDPKNYNKTTQCYTADFVSMENTDNPYVPQIPIDQWRPQCPEDIIFNHIRGAIIAPIHKKYNMRDDDKANEMIDYFYVSSKRCYNSDTKMKNGELKIGFREHCTNYMNYFEKYYDTEHQLFGLYARFKYFIDCEANRYTLDMFLNELWTYFINPNASYTAHYLNSCLDRMNIEQYNLNLNYKNNKSPVLEYSDFHAQLLLKISVMQNMMIPLITHFITKRKIDPKNVKYVLLKSFDLLFQITKVIYGVDLGSKIYETATSNVTKNVSNNSSLWDMQTIRGRNVTTHSIETVENILMQIIPKYTYDKNIIHFNYNAINRDIRTKVTGISYEYGFIVLSSSNRDDENNSECDKFEAHASKINEAIINQVMVNCSKAMEKIKIKYGPFDKREIDFYYHELCKDGKFIVNSLQRTLVDYLFVKEFDDTQSVRIVNIRDYIILIIAARRVLESYKMFQLPYMIGGRVNRIVTRKSINKKQLQKIESSEYFPLIHAKYNNEKIEKEVIPSLIAQIMSSEFQTVDYWHPEANGIPINIIPDVIAEEVSRFVMLI